MFFPLKMKKISVISSKNYKHTISEALLKAGVVDINSPKDICLLEGVKAYTPKESLDGIRDLKARIEGFLSLLKEENILNSISLDTKDYKVLNQGDIKIFLNQLGASIQKEKDRQKELQGSYFEKNELLQQIQSLPDSFFLSSQLKSSYININCGSIKKSLYPSFTKALLPLNTSIFLEGEREEEPLVILLSLKREKRQIESVFDKFKWMELEIPKERQTKDFYIHKLKKDCDEILKERDAQKSLCRNLVTHKKERLLDLWAQLRLQELFIGVERDFASTRTGILFSGWVPVKQAKALEGSLKRQTKGLIYIEWSDVKEIKEENIPVALDNPPLLKPFEALVTNYAIPRYGTIDPTPLTALFFLIMFGLMFGDVGQGLVILLIGLSGRLFKSSKKENLFNLIALCGFSAMIFGLLFGSYFGYSLFKPLWFSYHGVVMGHGDSQYFIHSIYDILKVSIVFGIIVIYSGLILNWINLFKTKNYISLFLSRTGLCGGLIYGTGVYGAFYFVRSGYRSLPSGTFLLLSMFLPLILLFFKAPLEDIKDKKRIGGKDILHYLLEGLVELLETFSGYLSNTLSFMRVAGLGIAHVSLMVSFFQMADLSHSFIGKIIILIMGNLLVIALEGLSAGIQSLRLNYYEFFSKYFDGSGRGFNPIHLSK